MKLIAKYLKPFAALVLVCLVLLFGQAMCDLSLPNLMSDIVNVGIQQGGVEAGAPEAMSQNGMTLLQEFMTGDEKALMEENYRTIEPESSEAQRLAEQYPLAREEAVCVLRTDLEEEGREAVDAAYGKASYAFLLYMQDAGESGELEEAARKIAMAQAQVQGDGQEGGFGSNLRVPSGEENASLPEGVIGQMPDDALYDLPEGSSLPEGGDGAAGASLRGSQESALGTAGDVGSAGGSSLRDSSEPVYGGESSQPGEEMPGGVPQEGANGEDVPGSGAQNGGNAQPGQNAPEGSGETGGMSFDLSDSDGFANIDMAQVYDLIPLLELVPRESVEKAMASAAQDGSSMMGDQVGVTFKKLFYRELGMDVESMQSAYIWQTGLKMLGVALLGVVATVLVGLFASRIAATVGKRLRHDLFAKVESFSNAEFDKFSTASLITRTTNDVQQVQMLITMGIRMVCYAPIMGIGGIIFAVGKSVSMSWIIAAAVVVLIGVIIVALSLAMPKFKSLQKLIDKLNLVSRENLTGMMVVRAFGNEGYEEQRFDAANKNLADTNRYVQRVMSAMMPAMMFIMNVVSIVIVWVGGHAIAESTLQIGDMMAFIQYAMQIIMSFLMIAMMFVMVPRASVSAVRIKEVLDTELEIKDADQPEKLENIRGKIEFKDVSFRYGGAESDVLEHISFTANPGETTAFIGATGSGKSTLINLIPRFYDVTEGEIDLDGKDIRKVPQKELREAIGYVPQKGVLFSGTIDSNIRYGKEDADAHEIEEAIQVAQAEEFVSELEEGAESPISQGGGNVSGGQKQRLSIARALVRRAPIYIFDDSFSALDFKTDAALRKALKETTADSTVLIVAQRVSTIMHAEQIIVLDGGRMVGKGTHRELLANCPEYREIAESQLQKEELE